MPPDLTAGATAAKSPVRLRTLADLRGEPWEPWGSCNAQACRRDWRLSLDRLVAGLGPGHPYTAIAPHLACPACGGRDCRVFFSATYAKPPTETAS